MRLGFHVSIAGGFAKALKTAQTLRCESVQFFSHNPRGWSFKPLDREDVTIYKNSLLCSGIGPVAVHMPYLPNFATLNAELYKKSLAALRSNLERAHLLGADFLIAHPGSCPEGGTDDVSERIANALDHALDTVRTNVMILLENTAGQKNEVGSRFPELQKIIQASVHQKSLGVCLDTAHAFAAGYDLATEKGLERSLAEFDRHIGIQRLLLIHLNDSKTALGSHVDRHWHIGKGHIGADGLRRIINHPFLHNLGGIMETPKEAPEDDRANMRSARKLRHSPSC